MQKYIIVAGTALHTIKAYKSLDSLRKHIATHPKLKHPGYAIDQIKALKKQGRDSYDVSIELEYKNGYIESLRIQRLPIL